MRVQRVRLKWGDRTISISEFNDMAKWFADRGYDIEADRREGTIIATLPPKEANDD